MASRAYRSAGLTRSLTLLWTFVLASAAILAAGAFVLSSVLGDNFREQILADSSRDVALYVRLRSRTRHSFGESASSRTAARGGVSHVLSLRRTSS